MKVRPEARSYYELISAKLKFNLPKPGFLDGVKSRVRCCLSHCVSDTLLHVTALMASRPITAAATYGLCNYQSAVGHVGFAFLCIHSRYLTQHFFVCRKLQL